MLPRQQRQPWVASLAQASIAGRSCRESGGSASGARLGIWGKWLPIGFEKVHPLMAVETGIVALSAS